MLAPCTRCQRHVRVHDVCCPFCGCETTRPQKPVALFGRISRIAVFTSTIFAANACAHVTPTGAVKGVATWSGTNMFGSQNGQLRKAKVILRSTDGKVRRTTKTNAQGEFEFDDVPVGSYEVSLARHRDDTSSSVQVDVHADSIENANLASHVALPYGAPPGRRRVV